MVSKKINRLDFEVNTKTKKALKEAAKFALRMTIFALPILINWLTEANYTEWATIATAVLALLDKFIHENKNIETTGIVPF